MIEGQSLKLLFYYRFEDYFFENILGMKPFFQVINSFIFFKQEKNNLTVILQQSIQKQRIILKRKGVLVIKTNKIANPISLLSLKATSQIRLRNITHPPAFFFVSIISPTKQSTRMLLRGIVSAPLPSTLSLKASARPSQNASLSFSISDQELESRGFSLRRSVSDLNLDHLNSVFVAVGFPKRDTEKIRVALENTESVQWVEYRKTQRPVAFARATGDGVFNAIIWDVVVDPSFQGIGLGKAVMERLLEELLGKGITNIGLYSEPRVLGFYRPLGFVADPDGIRGMVYSRKRNNKF